MTIDQWVFSSYGILDQPSYCMQNKNKTMFKAPNLHNLIPIGTTIIIQIKIIIERLFHTHKLTYIILFTMCKLVN